MQKMSETLTERISEAEREIACYEARLQTMTDEKTAVLGAATVDGKVLAKLEAEEANLPLKMESLRSRVALIAEQVEAAETEEARQRIGAIESEYQLLALSLAPQHQEWIDTLERLATLFAETQAGQAKLQLLRAEGAYLVERYGTRWAHCPPVPVAQRDDITKTLEPVLQKASWKLLGSNTWKEQTDAHRQKRNVAEAAGMATQRRTVSTQRMVKSSPVTFTLGGKA